jgi:hypothetical protein
MHVKRILLPYLTETPVTFEKKGSAYVVCNYTKQPIYVAFGENIEEDLSNAVKIPAGFYRTVASRFSALGAETKTLYIVGFGTGIVEVQQILW